ncbi:MAG: hypothetical protein ACK559_01510, partial [bacterium]
GPLDEAITASSASNSSLTRPRVMSGDEFESHLADSTEPEGSTSAKGTERLATPDTNEAAPEESSEALATQPPGGVPPSVAAATPSGKKTRIRAARMAA